MQINASARQRHKPQSVSKLLMASSSFRRGQSSPTGIQQVIPFSTVRTVVSILASCGALGINGSEIAEFYLLRARDFQCNSTETQTRRMQSRFIACICLSVCPALRIEIFSAPAVLSIYFCEPQESILARDHRVRAAQPGWRRQ